MADRRRAPGVLGRRLSRRTLLRGAGGAALALPFLDAMLPARKTVAQAASVPSRIVFFFTANGPNQEQWWPSGGESDFSLAPSMAPLAPFRDRLLILDGIRMATASEARGDGGNGHDVGTGHCLTARGIVAGPSGVGDFGHLFDGTAGGISIDQHIARSLPLGGRPFASLELGAKAEGIFVPLPSRIAYRGEGQPVTPLHTPGQTFDAVFAGIGASVEEGPPPQERRRQLVLSAVQGDLRRLRGRLGTADRERLDLHVGAIEELANRIDATGRVICARPEREDADDFPEILGLQTELLVRALQCDLTRVASVQCSTGQSGVRHRWLGHTESHHAISHKGDSDSFFRGQAAEIDTWYAERFAELLAGLAATEVGDGSSLLDHTTVVWVSEQEKGTGNTHRYGRMPYVIAGGDGTLKQGRYLNLPGRAHGELFVTLMNAMGVEGSTFGLPEYCDGPLDALLA
ncbi:MAG: DUF1552 domain-containing protein [Myxococcota bacterium]